MLVGFAFLRYRGLGSGCSILTPESAPLAGHL